jgi:sugar-specific transcriptional regulator TrmB
MDRLTEELGQFGWTPNEARCYVALVEQGRMKAKHIARETGINRSKIYEPLDKLKEKGYVRLIDEEPQIYNAQNPQTVIEEERRSWRENSQEVMAQLQEAWEYNQEYDPGNESAWVTKGRAGRRQEIDKAISEAESQIILYDNELFRLSRTIRRDLREAAQEGKEVKAISGSQSIDQLKRLQSNGSETWLHTETERSSFYLIDGQKAVLLPSGGENSIVIEDKDITRIIMAEFETLAQSAEEVPTE